MKWCSNSRSMSGSVVTHSGLLPELHVNPLKAWHAHYICVNGGSPKKRPLYSSQCGSCSQSKGFWVDRIFASTATLCKHTCLIHEATMKTHKHTLWTQSPTHCNKSMIHLCGVISTVVHSWTAWLNMHQTAHPMKAMGFLNPIAQMTSRKTQGLHPVWHAA